LPTDNNTKRLTEHFSQTTTTKDDKSSWLDNRPKTWENLLTSDTFLFFLCLIWQREITHAFYSHHIYDAF
jgi:hypothetical protein